MSPILWRWEEKDLGFRFRTGRGRRAAEHYQARSAGEYYVVPAGQRKLEKKRLDELANVADLPDARTVVSNPWRNYDREWDWIDSENGICLNWAGCLDREEIDRREDEGVQRAMQVVTELVQRDDPVSLTIDLVRQIHVELMGNIYPFAGAWRTVGLHKGKGPERWPLPPGGIQPVIDVFERDVLARSPVISGDDEEVFAYASEVMNEFLAIHPFREGNGRTGFILGNLVLMQNAMLPLNVYDRKTDQERYYEACEAGRIHKDYRPLAELLEEWEDEAIEAWDKVHE